MQSNMDGLNATLKKKRAQLKATNQETAKEADKGKIVTQIESSVQNENLTTDEDADFEIGSIRKCRKTDKDRSKPTTPCASARRKTDSSNNQEHQHHQQRGNNTSRKEQDSPTNYNSEKMVSLLTHPKSLQWTGLITATQCQQTKSSTLYSLNKKSYRAIEHHLNSQKGVFHAYQILEERCLRVVIRLIVEGISKNRTDRAWIPPRTAPPVDVIETERKGQQVGDLKHCRPNGEEEYLQPETTSDIVRR